MKLTVERIALRDTYTIGNFYIDGKKYCNTIEDKVRVLNSLKDKVYGETAIPYGTYKVMLTYSNKYKKNMLQIMDVPFFEGIRIHCGNTAKDSLGCIILGYNTVVGKVTESRKAYNIVFPIIREALDKGEKVTIEIKNKEK